MAETTSDISPPLASPCSAVVALKEYLDLSAVRDTTRQLARALACLHSRGTIHGDVKLLVSESNL